MSTFAADLGRWGAANNAKLQALARQSIQELAIKVQINTGPPVGPNIITGNLINSWQPGVNRMPPASDKNDDAGGGFTLGAKNVDTELAVVIASMKPGDVFYYVNNAAYAMRQNYGFVGADSLGRQYNQPGKFFLQKTVAQWSQIVARVAADLQLSSTSR